MSDPFNDWRSIQPSLDEVLYRDPSGGLRQIETSDGATRMLEVVTFSDGSRLAITAQVPLPPLDGMTPKKVSFIKLNGDRGEKLDDGSGEAMDLARQSVAIRFLENVARMLDSMPECEKVTCPTCHGVRSCHHCHGQGCSECQGKRVCLTCGGHGNVVKEL